MPSLAVQVADQLVASLTAATGFVVAFTAKRTWRPNDDLEKLSGTRISIIPTNGRREPASRGSRHVTLSFTIFLDRKLSADPATASTEADQLSELADQVAAHLESPAASALAGTPDSIEAITFDRTNDIVERSCFRQALRLIYPPLESEGGA